MVYQLSVIKKREGMGLAGQTKPCHALSLLKYLVF